MKSIPDGERFFPGIEVSSSILRCKIGQPFTSFTTGRRNPTRWRERAHIHSQGRYLWLLAQLKTLPDAEAAQLITDYEERKKAEARQRAQRDRLPQLAGLEKQAELYGRQPYQKRIEKLQRKIANAEERKMQDD